MTLRFRGVAYCFRTAITSALGIFHERDAVATQCSVTEALSFFIKMIQSVSSVKLKLLGVFTFRIRFYELVQRE